MLWLIIKLFSSTASIDPAAGPVHETGGFRYSGECQLSAGSQVKSGQVKLGQGSGQVSQGKPSTRSRHARRHARQLSSVLPLRVASRSAIKSVRSSVRPHGTLNSARTGTPCFFSGRRVVGDKGYVFLFDLGEKRRRQVVEDVLFLS